MRRESSKLEGLKADRPNLRDAAAPFCDPPVMLLLGRSLQERRERKANLKQRTGKPAAVADSQTDRRRRHCHDNTKGRRQSSPNNELRSRSHPLKVSNLDFDSAKTSCIARRPQLLSRCKDNFSTFLRGGKRSRSGFPSAAVFPFPRSVLQKKVQMEEERRREGGREGYLSKQEIDPLCVRRGLPGRRRRERKITETADRS